MSDIGGRALFEGITGGADRLAEGIKSFKEHKRQRKQVNANFQVLGEAVKGLVEQQVLPPGMLQQWAQAEAGGMETQNGFMQGIGQALQLQQSVAQEKRAAQDQTRQFAADKRAEEHLNIAKEVARQTAENFQFQKGERGKEQFLGEMLKNHASTGLPIEPENFMAYMAEAGITDPYRMARFMETSRKSEDKKPVVSEIGGQKVIHSPYTGQFQVLQELGSGQNVGEPIVDPEGNLLGYPVKVGNRTIFIRAPKERKPNGTVVDGTDGEYFWVEGQIKQRDAGWAAIQELTKRSNEKSSPTKATSSSSPAIKYKYDSTGKRVPVKE